ncbi:MAG: flagellar filament capping protein FliD [Phycisphaerales bacterium]|nr:flagellar filament capping protein FliD [Phycisphaerales bacterium]
MGGISANVGIFSGIDTKSLIDQLISIEARPKTLAQQRVIALKTQQAALLDVSSTLLALKSAAGAFRTSKTFSSAKATSSNPAVLTAVASTAAVPGTYNFTVSRLVSTDQRISRGFTDRDVSGVGAASITLELGGGRLDSETTLASLRGGDGVGRGKIRVSDGSGGSAVIDLSTAVTVNDVLEAINGATGVSLSASVDAQNGDRLRIVDTSGGAGQIVIENVFGSSAASDLGIATSGASGSVVGSVINYIGENTALSTLNDGTGVTVRSSAASDLKITARDGSVHSVRLGEVIGTGGTVTQTAASTLRDVIERIEAQTGGKVTAEVVNDRIRLIDATGASASDLIVEEAGEGRTTAKDLGILGSSASATLDGRRIISTINSRMASSLNGGSGVTAGSISVQRRDGSSFGVAIQADMSIADVIYTINQAGGGTVVASLNKAGNGLKITDSTTGGDLIITDVIGTAAANLGIETSGASNGVVDSGNLQTRYIAGATRLSDLNARTGVGTGSFRIVDSTGASSSVAVDSKIKTLDDLVALINSRPTAIRARINDQGDGLLLEDTANGGQAIRVEEIGGGVARKLGILGSSASGVAGSNRIDGSYEKTISLAATDTLDQIVTKINNAGVFATASVINDGSAGSPFRLSFTSKHSGSVGRLTIDSGDLDLGLSALTVGRDAVAFYGAADPAQAVLLTSSTNTLDNVIGGVTIDLNATSATSVELVVARDTAAIETAVKVFVESFNNVFARIGRYNTYNQETNQRGPLLGDATIEQIRRGLVSAVQGSPQGVDGQFTRLFQVGLRIGEGGKLQFDAERFRTALEADPESVQNLFAAFEQAPTQDQVLLTDANGNPIATTPSTTTTYNVLGVAEIIKNLAESFTNAADGVLTRRKTTLDSQIEQQNSRIGRFDESLERKRARLEAQFLAMERAIASLQGQQSALGSIQRIG